MAENIFKKDCWGKKEWDIFLSNLEKIRKHYRLKKGELNKLLGVSNIYRRDINRPGELAILKICREFSVTEEMLSEIPFEGVKSPPESTISSQDGEPYKQTPEHMLPKGHFEGRDSDSDEAGRSDIARHKVSKLITSAPGNDHVDSFAKAVSGLKAIFDEGGEETREVVTSIIDSIQYSLIVADRYQDVTARLHKIAEVLTEHQPPEGETERRKAWVKMKEAIGL